MYLGHGKAAALGLLGAHAGQLRHCGGAAMDGFGLDGEVGAGKFGITGSFLTPHLVAHRKALPQMDTIIMKIEKKRLAICRV